MQLNFLCRTVGVAVISTGILQLLFDALAWRMSSVLAAHDASERPRLVERCVFLFGLFSRTLPTAIAVGLLLPAYIGAEDNKSSENAGGIFAGVAVTVAICFVAQVARVLLATYRTHRRCEACTPIGKTSAGTEILLDPSDQLVFATTGMILPKIIVSRSVLEHERFSSAALEAGFAHEGAHVRQLDNLKWLLLSSLPHFNLRTKNSPSLLSRWRLFAEIAADEESASGSEARSLVLAEMLVTMAKESNRSFDQALMTLASRDEDLKVRVNYLLRLTQLDEPSHNAAIMSWTSKLAFISLAATCIVMAYVCSHAGHSIAEYLLHLG